MSFIDRARAQRLLGEAGIDALVLLQPESFGYATGASPGVAASWRRAGAAIAVVPAAADGALAAVVTDLAAPSVRAAGTVGDLRVHPMWVDGADVSALRPSNRPIGELIAEAQARDPGFARPETFDPRRGFALLRDILVERGLLGARLGIELDFLPVNDYALLKAAIPEVAWVDSSPLLARLRMVKTPGEIAILRQAVAFTEAGLRAATADLRAGVTRDAIAERWRDGAVAAARAAGGPAVERTWEYVAVGTNPWGGGALAPGDTLKFDVGCIIRGYSSDCGRTFVFGRADAHQREVHAALRAGFDAGMAAFRPGNTLADVHAAASAAIRVGGLPGFSRGHFGHGVGANVWTEEWPFVSATATIPLEADMVLAFETPFYVDGLGAFIIEDEVLVTASGAEPLNTMPRELIELG
ncbi:MAG: aminopeptidase P family protein [Alphaproteobacteria bacterium]|nr:aminopeptidase P family protein [Alphaproteobacteria bacterium]